MGMGKKWVITLPASILILGTVVPALTFSPNDVYATPSFTCPVNQAYAMQDVHLKVKYRTISEMITISSE